MLRLVLFLSLALLAAPFARAELPSAAACPGGCGCEFEKLRFALTPDPAFSAFLQSSEETFQTNAASFLHSHKNGEAFLEFTKVDPKKMTVAPKTHFQETMSEGQLDALSTWFNMPENINDKVRPANPHSIEDLAGVKCKDCTHLWEAMNLLPDYDGIVFRGVELDGQALSTYLTEGALVQDPGFKATSRDFEQANIHLDFKDPAKSAFMVIRSRTGKSIEKISGMVEQEVLFPPNTAFQVMAGQPRPAGGYLIYLNEVTPKP